MTTQTKPSAGAVRAAEALLKWEGVNIPNYIADSRLEWANVIDRESGLAELLEAARALVADVELEFDKRGITKTHAWNVTRHAIAKASNPNADIQQVAPAGRWTEKGTV